MEETVTQHWVIWKAYCLFFEKTLVCTTIIHIQSLSIVYTCTRMFLFFSDCQFFLTGVRWIFKVVLIYIFFLMASEVEHFLMFTGHLYFICFS